LLSPVLYALQTISEQTALPFVEKAECSMSKKQCKIKRIIFFKNIFLKNLDLKK